MQENGEGDACLTLPYAAIPTLKAPWRKLLCDAIVLTLQLYSSGLEEEEETLKHLQDYSKLHSREQFALQVRYGQKRILHQLLKLAS